jgi:hypothetical protein
LLSKPNTDQTLATHVGVPWESNVSYPVGSSLSTNWSCCPFDSTAFLLVWWEPSGAIESMTANRVAIRSIHASNRATDVG